MSCSPRCPSHLRACASRPFGFLGGSLNSFTRDEFTFSYSLYPLLALSFFHSTRWALYSFFCLVILTPFLVCVPRPWTDGTLLLRFQLSVATAIVFGRSRCDLFLAFAAVCFWQIAFGLHFAFWHMLLLCFFSLFTLLRPPFSLRVSLHAL